MTLIKIYVALLNEGTDCWRPVEAERLSDNVFRIVSPTPPDERWQFSRGDIVRCQEKSFQDGFGLVAIEKVTQSS